jgi:hypothetical protein
MNQDLEEGFELFYIYNPCPVSVFLHLKKEHAIMPNPA